ncbi:MAG: hypothetical protein K2G14_07835 [Ruminococcus sp.]|nr:hypothetical protein [Ruminococcus sp.]
MNEIQIFRNEEFGEIRTLEIDGQIYFVGADVAKALGYVKPRNAVNKYVDKEDALKWGILSNGGIQQTTIINESGLYSLILSSKLESAKKFKHWVTSEVLPAIRRTGTYGVSNIEEIFNRVLDEKIEGIVNKAVSEAIKVLSPFLTLPVREYTTEIRTIEKSYQYSSSKIFRLSPEIKKQVDEMIISGNYSCQQIANFITERSGMKISYMTISRYIKKYFIL